ncbi:MAG: hypothetical protein IJX04_00205 [Oscillospiraceae bacterium]|nr:hypothetical protein [Oscillospiraceae bacterium]
MPKTRFYKAFGLIIESDFVIAQIPETDCREADVRIVRSDLSGLSSEECQFLRENAVYARVAGVAVFRITNGNLIQVDPEPDCSETRLGVFLMGSSMGAILHQRGCIPLHGSCVTDGQRSILLTGDSGAGKSTLAAEFLRRGWKLITDDVSALYDIDGVPTVQSSYPSQKLWQDALDRYERPESDIHSLYFTDSREKFGVDVSRFFFDGRAPLSMVVRLLPHAPMCALKPIEGMTKVDQLMRNTYRANMIEQKNLQRHFQRCVTLSTKIPMAVVTRTDGQDCAAKMYELITDYLEEQNHD